MHDTTERKDVYSRITDQIIAQLEKGVRPWVKPWNAEHAAGRITRPLRHNGQPYSRHQYSFALDVRRAAGLRRAYLDDVPPGLGTERACPQRRKRLACGFCQLDHAAPNATKKPARISSAKFRT